jgi:hypothetical protein
MDSELQLKKVHVRTDGCRTDEGLVLKWLGLDCEGWRGGEEKDRPCQRLWRCAASLVWQIWGRAVRKTGQSRQGKMWKNNRGTHRAEGWRDCYCQGNCAPWGGRKW